MPLYDYSCERCGPFRAWQRMSECTAASECPECGEAAPRVPSAPFLADMNPHSRTAHQHNEKSAHEPQVMSRGRMKQRGSKRGGHAGHGHHGHHHHHHHSGRPWMIGH